MESTLGNITAIAATTAPTPSGSGSYSYSHSYSSSGGGHGAETGAECLEGYFPCSGYWTGNLFLVAVYGYIISKAAKTIADGSELLMDVVSPGVIGGLVIPLLGSLPDVTIIFVSVALGSAEEMMEQVHVGIGALAGSTVMLLTVAWTGGLLAGRCDIVRGKAVDRQLTDPQDVRNTGVTVEPSIRTNAIIMIVTLAPYFIIEFVSLFNMAHTLTPAEKVEREKGYVLLAFLAALVLFAVYSGYMVLNTSFQEQRLRAARKKLVLQKLADMFVSNVNRRELILDIESQENTNSQPQYHNQEEEEEDHTDVELEEGTTPKKAEEEEKGPKGDSEGFGLVDIDDDDDDDDDEKSPAAGEKSEDAAVPDARAEAALATEIMKSRSLQDMHEMIRKFRASEQRSAAKLLDAEAARATAAAAAEDVGKDLEGAGDADVGGGAAAGELSRNRLIAKALALLAVGTTIVVIFSDPLVDSISALAAQLHIKNFFVAFIVAPLASNASELITSIYFCSKKTSKSVSVA